VCGDFSFYQFPTPEYWQKFFAAAPESLRFALKIPEEVTAERFPKHPRYGPRAGFKNELYLDAEALKELFLEPLRPYRGRVASLIFEFGARGTTLPEFLENLEPFLAALPAEFRYAVEVRNQDYLGTEYFDCLRAHRIAHVFNAWTRMPALSDQMALPGSVTADFTVVRALLRQGRAYEDAVAQFSPYDQIRDENAEGREALRVLIQRMRAERRETYIFANNRFEGNAPETIRAIAEAEAEAEADIRE
jgi:uncharacterized protein YecE (DUF72 family)